MTLELVANVSLSERTTLGLGGVAEVEAQVRTETDLDELGGFLAVNSLRPFAIGWGSNLLPPDGHLDMALIRVMDSGGPERVEKTERGLVVRCGAAQRLPGLLGWAQKAGLSGLEKLTGIPGTVGGAVAMNAGSYGAEFGDLVRRVRVWSPMAGLHWVEAEACTFGYRHFSCGPQTGKSLIWEVEIELTDSTPKAVRAAMQVSYAKKKATQPVTAKTAGCVFKNPEGASAGLLMDQAGLKGARLGKMAFSKLHANFLVNMGGGTSDDALELIELARDAVKEKHGAVLEPEVVIL